MNEQTLIDIFQCSDQSTLANNYITSEDPPPCAWGYHSPSQSPMGKTSFPEVVHFMSGLLYSREPNRVLREHHVMNSTWVPWRMDLKGAEFTASRAVSKDCFFGEATFEDPETEGLLLLNLAAYEGVPLKPDLREDGLTLTWLDRFEIHLQFEHGLEELIPSGNPEAVKLHFAGREDIALNPNSIHYPISLGRPVWIGARFRGRIAYSIRINECGASPDFPVDLHDAAQREEKRWRTFFSEAVPPCPTSDPVARDTWFFSWLTVWANHCEGGTSALPHPFISPTRFHYGSQWWWDEVFHTGVMRHANPGAYNIYASLQNFFEAQLDSGAIPGCIRFAQDENTTPEDLGWITMVMQPPVIGFVMGLWKETPGWPQGKELEELYTRLKRLGEWFAGPERDPDGDHLSHYEHSFDSTSDQSPRWDINCHRDPRGVGPFDPIESVDMNVWLSLMWRHLAEMADLLGKTGEAETCRAKSQAIFNAVETLCWDEEDGFYYDIDAVSHERIRVMTPYGFMPLLHPDIPKDRADRIINEHMLNPDEFWTPCPLPSVARNHPEFDVRLMWRGPSWVNVNWMVVHGLERSGHPDIARDLARKTIELIGPKYDEQGVRTKSPRIWEWFNPLTGEELGNHHYGWTALVVDLMLKFDLTER